MAISRVIGGVALFCVLAGIVHGQSLVPGLMIFGDSIVDAGNNNYLHTIVKANFPPYGRDFINHLATGRFCNGKLASDFTAENLGFTSYPPAYLSREARGKKLLIGANFASASSGYYDNTAKLFGALTLTQQLENYKQYQTKLVSVAGAANASTILSGSIYLLSGGSSDFVQNYYVNPLLYEFYSADQFSDILIQSFSSFVQNLYVLGARKIGVTSLPPIGCLPASITLFGHHSNECVENMNRDAISFNRKLNSTAINLTKKFSNLTIVVFDIYQPLLDIIKHPTDNGFFEARKACCGTGTIETSLLCNSKSPGTCKNASTYVFWDGFHPTEATNKALANNLLTQGIALVS